MSIPTRTCPVSLLNSSVGTWNISFRNRKNRTKESREHVQQISSSELPEMYSVIPNPQNYISFNCVYYLLNTLCKHSENTHKIPTTAWLYYCHRELDTTKLPKRKGEEEWESGPTGILKASWYEHQLNWVIFLLIWEWCLQGYPRSQWIHQQQVSHSSQGTDLIGMA